METKIGNCLDALHGDGRLSRVWAQRLPPPERVESLRGLVTHLGERYERATLDSFEVYDDAQREPLGRLQAFALEMPQRLCTGGGLILKGKPGTGKDHLVAALLKIAVARHGLTVGWWDCLALFREVRLSIDEGKQRDLLKTLSGPQILALSDPQPPKGQLSDWQVGIIRDAIDTRYRSRKSTWLTTNLTTKDDAEELLTKPLLERLKERSLQIKCDWSSYRERVG